MEYEDIQAMTPFNPCKDADKCVWHWAGPALQFARCAVRREVCGQCNARRYEIVQKGRDKESGLRYPAQQELFPELS